MIGRLLLALLLAIGAMPGAAMPADCQGGGAAMVMAADHAGRHERRPAMIDHGCIGCAALADWLAERVAPPVTMTAAAPSSAIDALVVRAAGPPRLPPPRIG